MALSIRNETTSTVMISSEEYSVSVTSNMFSKDFGFTSLEDANDNPIKLIAMLNGVSSTKEVRFDCGNHVTDAVSFMAVLGDGPTWATSGDCYRDGVRLCTFSQDFDSCLE